MVKSFNFSSIPKICFGLGKINNLEKELAVFGKSILVISGTDYFDQLEKKYTIVEKLLNSGFRVYKYLIAGEPSPELIDDIVAEYKPENIDVVVGIGGGSAIDTGKAVSAMLLAEGSVKDYLEGVGTLKHNGVKIPYIAIPTTSGTGSETTKNAVISEVGEKGFKKSLRHDNFVPNIAIVDPELTISCPKEVTAASGMDAFSQLLESFLSLNSSSFTEILSLDGLKAIKASLLSSCLENKKNIDAKVGMSYAAMVSGITLANAGLGTVHGFASSIGGYFNIPHGVVCGSLMAVTNKLTIQRLLGKDKNNKALDKYLTVSKIFVDEKFDKSEKYLHKFIEKLEVYTDLLNIPKLGKFGVQTADIPKIVEATENKANPYQLTNEDLEIILNQRI